MDYYQIPDITDKERNGITELRERVEKEMSSDLLRDRSVFIRFLRARECNVDKATEMLRNHIEWRKTLGFDNLQDYKAPEVMKYYFSTSRIGLNKLSNVVRYTDLGNLDFKGMLKSVKHDDVFKSVVKFLELDVNIMIEQSIKHDRAIDKWISIYNFENFSFVKASSPKVLQFCIQFSKLYEANYPERLHTLMVINASAYFTMLFNVVKPIFTARTLKKLVVFGKDGWKEELQKLVDADVLPVFLGGNRTDENGDPMCRSFITHGQLVPESYYLRNPLRRLNNQPDCKKLIVSRISKTNIELDAKRAGDFIKWQFETESGDIAFGLFLKVGQDDNSTLKEVLPVQKVEADVACETGTYLCEEPGKYILQFDNSHSWLRGKEIYYRVEVVKTA